jgi:hypothetical protein
MEGRVDWRGDSDAAAEELATWAEVGASHVSVNTMSAGLKTIDDHLAVLSEVAASLADPLTLR